MNTIYQKNIETDDMDYILSQMNKFDDYDVVTPEKFSDILNVDRYNKNSDINRKLAAFQNGSSGTAKFLNLPSALNGITTLFYRDVLYRSSEHVLIKITESWPVTGRIWMNFFNTNKWGGWKCIRPQKGYNYPSMTSAFGNIGNDSLVTAYGTVSFQKLSDDTGNLFITAKIDRNIGTDSTYVKVFDLNKILSLVGLTGIGADVKNSVVLIKNNKGISVNMDVYEGYGFGCEIGNVNGERMMYIGRFYTNTGSFGAWGIAEPIYIAGTIFHIAIYNASYT